MNKTELIAALAEKAETTKTQASAVLDAFIETITDQLQAGDKVTLIGFGTFETAKRAARAGKNPRTGEPLKIAAATVPKFKAGKALKDAMDAKPKKRKK